MSHANIVLLSNDQFIGPKTLAISLKFLALSMSVKLFKTMI
jgi:hypothetical protein